MLPPGLETPTQVKQYYLSLYETLITSGTYEPFLYPQFTLGFGVALVYLTIPYRKSALLHSLRIPLFVALFAHTLWTLTHARGRSPAASYGVGIICSWGLMWCATIMLWHDPHRDLRRWQYRDSVGLGWIKERGNSDKAEVKRKTKYTSADSGRAKTGPVVWQGFPSNAPLLERLDWVVDLFTNFRGVGWNFEVPDMPPPPEWVSSDLQQDDSPGKALQVGSASAVYTTGRFGHRRYTSRRALFTYCAIRLTIGFLLLDIIKVLMQHDPYFWGYTKPSPPAPSWLPSIIQQSAVLTRSYRLGLSLFGVLAALNQILRCGPVVFSILLGPGVLGLRGEPFMNIPDFFGAHNSPVLSRGLSGWWSGFWHQTFRAAFAAPVEKLLAWMNIPPRSDSARLLASVLAFGLSSLLHIAGSSTMLGHTRPIRGAGLFFLVQPFGILAQTYFVRFIRKSSLSIPPWLGYMTNLVFTYVWLYHTAPLLVDDFAEGGVWLYEPLPISPLRGLGFGARDDGPGSGGAVRWYWLWDGLVFWHQGKGWWDSGLAL